MCPYPRLEINIIIADSLSVPAFTFSSLFNQNLALLPNFLVFKFFIGNFEEKTKLMFKSERIFKNL